MDNAPGQVVQYGAYHEGDQGVTASTGMLAVAKRSGLGGPARPRLPAGRAAWAAWGLLAFALSTEAAVFTNRANVNVLASYNANVTASRSAGPTIPASDIRASTDSTSGWNSGNLAGPDPDTYLTFDLGSPRNVRTIRLRQWDAYHITNAEVRASDDGALFSAPLPLTHTYAGGTGQIVLNEATNTRYVRLTGTGYADANRRWIVFNARIFGDPGEFTPPDNDVDLVSRTGVAGGVALTRTAGVSITDTTDAEFIDDALSPLKRPVIYDIDQGEGFTVSFTNRFEFMKFGFYTPDPTYADPNADFIVEVSLDNVNWEAPVLSLTSCPAGFKMYDLTPKVGRHVRFTYTNTATSGFMNYISDVLVFGRVAPSRGTVILIL